MSLEYKPSLGFVETAGLVIAIQVADAMAKAAEVEIISAHKVDGLRACVICKGDVAACQAAVETGALLAQQDDVAATGETVASAAYLHGLAAAIASESEQQGWQEPELIGREHRQRFMTLGHPIVAGDVAHAIPEAIADVIA